MKILNFSSIDMAIHDVADLEKALQTPCPESPFQVGDSQPKGMRELNKNLMQKFNSQTCMHCTHNACLVAAPNMPPSIFTGSGLLWGKIWAPRGYHPYPRCTKNGLQDIWGLVWKSVLWTKLGVGLLQMVSAVLNAKLWDQSIAQISISHPQLGPICTPSMYAPKLWV